MRAPSCLICTHFQACDVLAKGWIGFQDLLEHRCAIALSQCLHECRGDGDIHAAVLIDLVYELDGICKADDIDASFCELGHDIGY